MLIKGESGIVWCDASISKFDKRDGFKIRVASPIKESKWDRSIKSGENRKDSMGSFAQKEGLISYVYPLLILTYLAAVVDG